MLVLKRKIGRSVIVPDLIEFKILDIQGTSVVVGINAADEVDVLRDEVYTRMLASKEKELASPHQLDEI